MCNKMHIRYDEFLKMLRYCEGYHPDIYYEQKVYRYSIKDDAYYSDPDRNFKVYPFILVYTEDCKYRNDIVDCSDIRIDYPRLSDNNWNYLQQFLRRSNNQIYSIVRQVNNYVFKGRSNNTFYLLDKLGRRIDSIDTDNNKFTNLIPDRVYPLSLISDYKYFTLKD